VSGGEIPEPDAAIANSRRQLHAALDHSPTVELPRLEAILNGVYKDDPETLQLLAALVRQIAPRHVIVFGCDATCELVALLGFEHGRMGVTVFEHDPWAAEEWINAASPYAVNYRWLSFCICPLVTRRCGSTLRPVYDDGMTLPVVPDPADLVVINGPPEELGGRSGTIYQALKYARAGSIVLVLNVREGEAEMFEAWVIELETHLQFAPPGLLSRHLAFIVREPLAEPVRLERPQAQAAACTDSPA
jgi:hypothetical protein